MTFDSMILENFGKLHGKEIRLAEGLNLICGENESGKSTIHTFLKSMLFGMERGRGRAAAGDTFRRYEPWEQPSYYAGKLYFTCGGRRFCLERHFDRYTKGGSLVCLDDGEELSLEQGDMEMLLGGMRETEYENTVFVGQLRSAVGSSLAAALKDYAANYYAAGSSEIRLEAAIETLRARQRETEKEIRGRQADRQLRLQRTEQEADYVRRDMRRLEKEIDQARQQRQDCARRLEEQESQTPQEDEKTRLTFENWRVHPLMLLLQLALVFLTLFLLPRPWNFLAALVVALAEGIYVWNRLKDGKRRREETRLRQEEALRERRAELEKCDWTLAKLSEDHHEKEVQYENLEEQYAEEETAGEELCALEARSQALELAASTIRELSGQMQEHLGQLLNHQVSQAFRDMTGGKYEKVWADEKMDLFVLSQGRKISLNQLSRGTIEQLYLALRLTAARILCSEPMPVLLDDALAFYDDRRLERTLRMLSKHPSQVILLTCQDRERRLLEKRNIPYTLIQI